MGGAARGPGAPRLLNGLARPSWWLLLAALFESACAAEGNFAVLQVVRANGKAKYFGALFAEWSPKKESTAVMIVHPKADPHGCSPLRTCKGCALFVLQGGCTFAQKARNAQAARMGMLIVASNSAEPPKTMATGPRPNWYTKLPRIPALMVSQVTGRHIMSAISEGKPLVAHCRPHEKVFYDLWGEGVIAALAVALVVLGAWHSVGDLRNPGSQAESGEEVVNVENSSGFQFVIFGSLMLVVLFFLMKYLIYALLFLFATGAVSTTTMLLEPVVGRWWPNLRERKAYRLPQWMSTVFGTLEDHTYADAIAETCGIILALAFLVYRNNDQFGWALQDVIGIMLLLTIQRTLRLPNLKVGTVLLVCTFFFDIFWVFISPLIFRKSVMIEVATGGGTGQSVPMVLKIPSLARGDIPGQFKILGLGDIAIPGLLLSLLLRHDLLQHNTWRRGYFVPGTVGYALGLLATFVSLYLMKHGQPALLFLVPGTLLPTFAIALKKGEFEAFWHAKYGVEVPPEGYEPLQEADKQA